MMQRTKKGRRRRKIRGPERVERRDGVGAGEGIKGEMPEPVVERHHRLVAGWRWERDGGGTEEGLPRSRNWENFSIV